MKHVSLNQGDGELVSLDAIVSNPHTNSCGLVVAYFEDESKVACYHWPGFLTDNRDYCNYFDQLCSQFGPDRVMTKLIAIINRPIDIQNAESRRKAALHLKSQFSNEVEFHYCTINYTGNMMITLNIDNTYSIYEIYEEVIL